MTDQPAIPTRPTPEETTLRTDLLMREYEVVSAQIIHWDTFFWTKSQFFLAIEAISLGFVVNRIAQDAISAEPLDFRILVVLALFVLFNVILCYTWFRTNRSNHEYIRVRFMRGLELEETAELRGTVYLLRRQREILSNPPFSLHSSSSWELHIPSMFIAAWCLVLLAAGCATSTRAGLLSTGLLVVALLAVIYVMERTGFPKRVREKICAE